jgi:hypothetical protein
MLIVATGPSADQAVRSSPTSTEAELRGTFSEEALKQLSHQLAASGILPSAASSPSWIPGKDWLLMSALFHQQQQQQQQRMRDATMAAMQACNGDMSSCWAALMQQQQVNQPPQGGSAPYSGNTSLRAKLLSYVD